MFQMRNAKLLEVFLLKTITFFPLEESSFSWADINVCKVICQIFSFWIRCSFWTGLKGLSPHHWHVLTYNNKILGSLAIFNDFNIIRSYMKQGNVQEHEPYRWEYSFFIFPCICSCCLPSCAFSYTFLFICKHAEVISALLRCCNNVANCLAFQWSIFDPGSSKQQWLTKAVNFFLSLILCEPCQRNLPCCTKWLLGWDFTDSSSQGLAGSSSIPPFLLSA